MDTACMSPETHLILGREGWHSHHYFAEQLLQQSTSQHHNIVDQHRSMVDSIGQQADQDEDFEERLLKLMHDATEADRRVMTTAFRDNPQVLRESLNVMHDMSQTMTTYYRGKSRERYSRDNPAAPHLCLPGLPRRDRKSRSV